MTTWRMAFRAGNQGAEMWPRCRKLGVAAITYSGLARTDLSKHTQGEPRALWAKLNSSQKASLRRVAYEMKAGDVIYVKQGPRIVGKGVVQGPYFFDAERRIVDPHGTPWLHQVPVKWDPEFPTIRALLGAEPLTVKELTPAEVSQIESEAEARYKAVDQMEAHEGEVYRTEAAFRSRNRALILAKKANSDYCCEVCGLSFEQVYGEIGQEYIVAHHTRPLASGPEKTTLDDIALLCANCHAMIHVRNPPLTIERLRKLVRRPAR